MAALSCSIAKQQGKPSSITGLTTPYLRFQPLAGFAAAAPQTASQTFPFIPLEEGMTLDLTLTVTSLSGTLDIEIQEVNDPNDVTENLETLLGQQFRQPPTNPTISAQAPFVSKIVSVTKGYVRVVATLSAGGSAVWQITGHGRSPGRSQNH
jgi:hypothetical protein